MEKSSVRPCERNYSADAFIRVARHVGSLLNHNGTIFRRRPETGVPTRETESIIRRPVHRVASGSLRSHLRMTEFLQRPLHGINFKACKLPFTKM